MSPARWGFAKISKDFWTLQSSKSSGGSQTSNRCYRSTGLLSKPNVFAAIKHDFEVGWRQTLWHFHFSSISLRALYHCYFTRWVWTMPHLSAVMGRASSIQHCYSPMNTSRDRCEVCLLRAGGIVVCCMMQPKATHVWLSKAIIRRTSTWYYIDVSMVTWLRCIF